MLAVVVPLVLLANGLAAGVLVGTQLGGWPLLLALPPDRYVHAHAFFTHRYDPFMPICLLITIGGDVVLAVGAPGVVPRLLFCLGALLVLATITVSITRNVPVNRWLRTLDPNDLPADFAARDPRRYWGSWNRLRSACALVALLANCLALAVLV